MPRLVTLDLDHPSAARLQEVVDELEHRHAIRWADPELRQAIEKRLSNKLASGALSEEMAAEIRTALAELLPAAVLDAFRDHLIDDKPALGAFPRGAITSDDTPDAWLRADPCRLASVLRESYRFTRPNLELAVEGVVALARTLGIEETTFVPILTEAAQAITSKGGGQRVG
jgi:hypothetical protein